MICRYFPLVDFSKRPTLWFPAILIRSFVINDVIISLQYQFNITYVKILTSWFPHPIAVRCSKIRMGADSILYPFLHQRNQYLSPVLFDMTYPWAQSTLSKIICNAPRLLYYYVYASGLIDQGLLTIPSFVFYVRLVCRVCMYVCSFTSHHNKIRS